MKYDARFIIQVFLGVSSLGFVTASWMLENRYLVLGAGVCVILSELLNKYYYRFISTSSNKEEAVKS